MSGWYWIPGTELGPEATGQGQEGRGIMGYGCTAKAGMVMDTFRGDGGSSNVWHYKGVEYFWEQGRENADGAITGSVWTTTGYCKGSYRISAEGHIERASCGLRSRLDEQAGLARYYRAYEPREAWAKACEFDGIPAGSSFVVFSADNPYA